MKWSVSTTKLFQTCPRKYYYQQILADKNSDDPRARESYELKQLKNLYNWRGNLVDEVISRFVIPRINRGENLNEGWIIAHAKDLMRADLDSLKSSIGRSNNHSENHGFFELEYGIEVTEDTISSIENEVVTSLKNLFGSQLLAKIIEDGGYLVPQRRLYFEFGVAKISCMPDLIVFPKNSTPKIIDWKVESVIREHWLQLGIYGYALSKINPHKDFPSEWHDFIKDPRKIELIEVQLLRNKMQTYQIKDDDVVDIEDYIHVTSKNILKLIDKSEIDINQFPTTNNPYNCQKCQFRKICWRELGNDSS